MMLPIDPARACTLAATQYVRSGGHTDLDHVRVIEDAAGVLVTDTKTGAEAFYRMRTALTVQQVQDPRSDPAFRSRITNPAGRRPAALSLSDAGIMATPAARVQEECAHLQDTAAKMDADREALLKAGSTDAPTLEYLAIRPKMLRAMASALAYSLQISYGHHVASAGERYMVTEGEKALAAKIAEDPGPFAQTLALAVQGKAVIK